MIVFFFTYVQIEKKSAEEILAAQEMTNGLEKSKFWPLILFSSASFFVVWEQCR